jgi:two-component system chemotaxis response regulator CheB
LYELIPKIRALCHLPSAAHVGPGSPAVLDLRHKEIRVRLAASRPSRPEIVAIGVSTGGPDALARLLPTLPKEFPLPIVVVQHMPPIFTEMLAKRLSEKCRIPVRECKTGTLLEPGCIWLAPGDYHMVVHLEGGLVRLRTNQAPRENFCRPSVDVLFRSVAAVYAPRTLGIILTGMGQDGLIGCQALNAAGANIIVQDEATSVVWGMPGFVARAGLAEKILPLDQIGGEICRRVAVQPLAEVRN